jgi:DNA-binding transcriptional regulator YiaG
MKKQVNQGVNNPKAKLDDDKVAAIRGSTLSQRVLAKQFGVSPSTIWRVKAGENWK